MVDKIRRVYNHYSKWLRKKYLCHMSSEHTVNLDETFQRGSDVILQTIANICPSWVLILVLKLLFLMINYGLRMRDFIIDSSILLTRFILHVTEFIIICLVILCEILFYFSGGPKFDSPFNTSSFHEYYWTNKTIELDLGGLRIYDAPIDNMIMNRIEHHLLSNEPSTHVLHPKSLVTEVCSIKGYPQSSRDLDATETTTNQKCRNKLCKANL